ncbi:MULTISPECIES: carbonic anhydrase [Bacillaceae]|uniref:carbonic anhydrase n=1 Tax=Evansella alkalicola TaxID=745819 RepID=A0ABS6JVT2_9BACI|nr:MULTISPECIES: carbonic anhydrase [Bacillaceae]MBU9722598.1 carbonate dehydratase [Bacillus alkalicola]
MEDMMLKEKNEAFIQNIKKVEPAYFDELKKGQHPEYFVLACSDSRVSPSVITQMPLGKLFVHRNIANQVAEQDESFSASLYYALKHLKVKKIVIQGHTDCGGVKAARNDNDESELRGWLGNIKRSLPEKGNSETCSLEDLTKINVLEQVKHLKEHPIYQEYGEGIEIIGCLFHVETGLIEWIN